MLVVTEYNNANSKVLWSEWHTLLVFKFDFIDCLWCFTRQLILLNDTKQLIENVNKREIFLTNGSFEDGIEIQTNVSLQSSGNCCYCRHLSHTSCLLTRFIAKSLYSTLLSSFSLITFCFAFFWRQNIGKKCAH